MRNAPLILVVEDNPMTRKMLRVTLESEGYSVVEAGDGKEAIAAMRRRVPELVLQDLVLPDINGFDLVRKLHEMPGAAEVPIVAVSGFLGRIQEAQTAQAGFSTLLVKPVEPTRLLDEVRGHFPARSIPSNRVGEGRRLLVVDDDPVQLKVTRLYFSLIGFEVEAVGSAHEALAAARARPPDALVADILMPHVDGFELCFEVRADPQLARIPVLLLSAWYQTETDRDLARRVGANALIPRTPDLADVASAVSNAIRGGVPAPAEPPTDRIRLEHAKSVVHQLDRQLAVTAGLARRCTLQAAQISLLSGVADALTRRIETEVALRDVLAATLDAAGISKGALFLESAQGVLELRQAIGFSEGERELLPGFFGHLSLLTRVVEQQGAMSLATTEQSDPASRAILNGAGVATMQIVPLVMQGRGVGATLLGARQSDVTTEDSVAFARAMGNQLAQSLELARTFARLTASELRYRTLLENAHDAIALFTPEGIVREANRRWEQLLGVPRDLLVGRHLGEFIPSPGERELLASVRGQGAPERVGPLELLAADASRVLLEFTTSTLEVGGERLILSVGRDVTDWVQSQTQLIVSDRMASIGTLAAGVAHEINNPLAAVMANLDAMAAVIRPMAKAPGASMDVAELLDVLSDTREAARRVRNIVGDLKLFSRAEEERKALVDVNRVIESSIRMAWNEIRHRAQLTRDYGQVPSVLANESRLGQVFLNLLVNAAQAIAEGKAQLNEIRVSSFLDQAKKNVVVEIADTGVGISLDFQRKLFTPFFTTKPTGLGTGLGLAICHRIVTSLGGKIEVESSPGRGALFRVTLPMGSQSEALPSASAPPLPSQHRGRILIIDDEKTVGSALGRLLKGDHDVTVTTSAQEALVLMLGGEHFDVILCDLMMPTMTGMDLHAELSQRLPDQARRMVFLTGGAFTHRARAFLDQVPNPRLEKPFDVKALFALLHERLSRD